MNKTHTLIISDLHLGSKVSRAQTLSKFLKNFEFKKLILLGDVFESLNFNTLNKNDWELLMYFSELAKKRKVRWIVGNHDKGLTDFFSSLTNIKIYNQYVWNYAGIKYLAIHGHQFDSFLIHNPVLGIMANKIYKFIQMIDFADKRISRFIKQKSKGWLKVSNQVAEGAMLYGKVKGADVVFCGHTHKSMQIIKKNIQYYNSGCWTDIPSTYITVDKLNIQIHKYYN